MPTSSERWAVVSSAVEALRSSGHQAWRTHIQKLFYFAADWNIGPATGYEFVIHRFGPYSFDLDHDIADMQSFGVLDREAAYRLGVSYSVSEAQQVDDGIRDLAEWLGPKTVHDLEALATTEFVRRRNGDDGQLVARVLKLKPHLSEQTVRDAQRELLGKRAALGVDG